jgi:CRISPR-associated protein Csb2
LRVGWDGLVEAAEAAYDAAGRAEELAALVAVAERGAKPDKALKPAASPRGRHDPRHRWHGYAEGVAVEVPSGYWDSRILVLEQIDGDRIGLASTWQLAEVFHKTLLDRWTRRFGDQAPAWISGHRSGSPGETTAPSLDCHLAAFPLAFVDANYASGHLLGMGLAFPKPEVIGADPASLRADWRKAMAALFSEGETLELAPRDRAWTVRLAVESSPKPQRALQPSRWIRPSRDWSTVTPIILDRHPKPNFKKDPRGWRDSCARIIAEACLRIGLPEPEEISVSPQSPVRGVPSSSQFVAPGQRPGRPTRFHIHASLRFREEVSGPILLGAGRFRGYGLCLPRDSKDTRTTDE